MYYMYYTQLPLPDFSVVDLRWGIRAFATDDHKATEICLSEINSCMENTIEGVPCFIYLGFNRYGNPGLPRTVPDKEMDHLMEKIVVSYSIFQITLVDYIMLPIQRQ